MKSMKIIVSFMFACILFIQPIFAEDANALKQTNKHDMSKFFEKLSNDLNLTAEQKTKIQSLQNEQKTIMPNLMNSLRQKHKELDTELMKDKYDMKTVNKLVQEVASVENKLAWERINAKVKMRNILSSEQFKKLEENMHKKGFHKKQKPQDNK